MLLNKKVMTLKTSMAHICGTGTMGRLKSWHIYVPLTVAELTINTKKMTLTMTIEIVASVSP